MFLKNYQNFLYLILILLSLIPKIYFFQTQSYLMQGLYDISGHIDYVKYISSNFSLPPWYQCWECFQQPIYYITASIIYKYLELIGLISETNLITFLQIFAFFLFYIFLLISIAIFRLVLPPKQSLIASSLILFWPSGAIHAARIGNDLLLYVFLASSLYFLIRWWIKSNIKSLITSVVFLLLGMLTKTNALVMLPVIICGYLIKKPSLKRVVIFLTLLSLSVGLTMIANQRNNLSRFKQDNWLIGNWGGMPKHLYVGNSWENFIFFDINSYLQYPNINPGTDAGGRQYFWIYLIKTSLYGEFTIENILQQNLAQILSLAILILIIYMIIGLISLDSDKLKFYSPFLLTLFSLISAVMINRIYFSAAGSNDFRYIYPALIPILVLVAYSADFFSKRRVLMVIYISTIVFFTSLSFLLHLIPSIFP